MLYKVLIVLLGILCMGCVADKPARDVIQTSEKKTRVLYFGATWCSPCRKMKAEVLNDSQVKKELKKVDFKMYDIDVDKDMKKLYRISVVPTTLIINGDKMKRYTGGMSKSQFLSILSKETR